MHEEKTFQIRFNQILYDEMSKTFELTQLPLDPDFKIKYSTRDEENVCIKSDYLGCIKTGGLRFGEMDFGGAMCVHYGSVPPAKDYDFPILGYDFVNASKFLIGVIDLHPIFRDGEYFDKYIFPLKDVVKKYEWIPKAEGGRSEVHEWAQFYDSGYSFYRWCEGKYLNDLEEAFKDYVRVFYECIKKAEPLKDKKVLLARNHYMAKYMDEYTHKDPGSAPLKHHFGEEWGERYFKDFLFVS